MFQEPLSTSSRYAILHQQRRGSVGSTLDPRTEKYATGLTLPDGRHGIYFPEAVVEPFLEALQKNNAKPPASEKKSGPIFSLEDSKTLILDALRAFDPSLHRKASDIFAAGFDEAAKESDNPSFGPLWNRSLYFADVNTRNQDSKNLSSLGDQVRWRIAKVSTDRTFMMRCLPAESPASALGPANTHPHAVIDYHFDGTINSVIYMAHELGHAIADDRIRERGYNFDSNPQHMNETQAYYVQNIAYDHLARHSDVRIAEAAQQHFENTLAQNMQHVSNAAETLDAQAMERLHSRPIGILVATGIFDVAKRQDMQQRQQIGDALLGGQGPKDITRVLATAGITTRRDMQALVARTIAVVATTPSDQRRPLRPVTVSEPLPKNAEPI